MSASAQETRWIARAREGDRDALEQLVKAHSGQMMRFAMRMCGNHERAQDTVQDALVNVVKAMPGFRGDSEFSTWLFTVVRRACLHRVRKRKHEPAQLEELDHARDARTTSPDGDPVAAAGRRELSKAIEDALAQLEPRSREVILLRDVEELPAEEVAQVLGIGVPAVKSRLHRARLQLRQALSPHVSDEPTSPECVDIVAMFSRNMEGEITAADCKRMQKHVDGCPRCRTQCHALRRVVNTCASLPTGIPAADRTWWRQAVRAAIHDD